MGSLEVFNKCEKGEEKIMYTELSCNELLTIEGGVNGWLLVGGTLIVIGGVAECCTVGLSVSGAATVIGGAGMFVAGLK